MFPLLKVRVPLSREAVVNIGLVLMLLNYIFYFREKRVNWDFLG